MTNTKYDSKAEADFHSNHPELISCHNFYPSVFFDDWNEMFKAKSDFYDRSTQTYIELKSHQLNTKETRTIALEKWEAQQPYITKHNKTLKMCENQWGHSLYKQAIVQHTLAKQKIRMVVLFKNGTKITTRSKNLMKLNGLTWFMESDYFK